MVMKLICMVFLDANWAGDVDNQHSTSENVFRQAYSTNSWCIVFERATWMMVSLNLFTI